MRIRGKFKACTILAGVVPLRCLNGKQEQAADKFRYIMWGTFDEPGLFPPKGEFFCKYRAGWMPEVPGK